MPPATARVEAGLTANDVIPPISKRASSGVNLKIGVDDRGSQKMSVPSASAVTIRFPVFKRS